MSYKALYRTHRPKTFDDVVGQDHIVNTLKNVIASDKVRHAYLFAGPRGTGKTSVAHVFARAINKTASGSDGFDDLDIIEIDAASNNGVADVRTLIESSSYAPTKARYKVYIIDEVHMMTKGAFNALLKTLEEPPKHIVFVLATTEPHKIPTTILSRCQRFNFRRIDNEVIKKQLRNVLDQEKISYDDESIKFIAELSQGGMRDALSISDQSAAFGNGSISFETIAQVFGVVSTGNQIKLINYAYEGQAKHLMKLVSELIENGADIERVSTSLLGIIKDYIVYAKTHDYSLLENITTEEFESIKITVSYAYEVIDILMKLLVDLRFTEVPKQSFELAILKMARSKEVSEPVRSNDDIFKTDTFSTKVEPKPVEFLAPEPEKVSEVVEEADALFDIAEDQMQEETQLFEIAEDVVTVTSEFSVTDALVSETETINKARIEESTTQKISLEAQPFEQVVEEEKTPEPDSYLKLFDINDESVSTSSIPLKQSFSNDEIINLFILGMSYKEYLPEVKAKWADLLIKGSSPRLLPLASMLEESKIAAAGENFVLSVTTDNEKAKEIYREHKSEELIELSNEIFGKPTWIYTISRDHFEEIKKLWGQLNDVGLPEARRLPSPVLKQKPKTEAEELGTALFGDLFRK